MATLVLQTVGAALGGASAGRSARRSGARSAGSPAPRSTARCSATSPSARRGPAPQGRGRARPRPRARRSRASTAAPGSAAQLIWATRFEEVVNTSVERDRRAAARVAAAGRDDRHHHLQLLRQSRRRPVRGPDRLRAPDLGGRARARPHTRSSTASTPGPRRQPPDPLIVAKEGGGERPGLSRPRLHGVRAPAARRVRQPRAAILLRGDPPGGGPRRHGPGGVPDPGLDRVRLRPPPVVARSSGSASREPENRHQFERATDVAASLDALAGDLPEPPAGVRSSRAGSATTCAPAPARSGPGSTASTRRPTPRPGPSAACRARKRVPVSTHGGGPAYGGSPSDAGVVRLDRRR